MPNTSESATGISCAGADVLGPGEITHGSHRQPREPVPGRERPPFLFPLRSICGHYWAISFGGKATRRIKRLPEHDQESGSKPPKVPAPDPKERPKDPPGSRGPNRRTWGRRTNRCARIETAAAESHDSAAAFLPCAGGYSAMTNGLIPPEPPAMSRVAISPSARVIAMPSRRSAPPASVR